MVGVATKRGFVIVYSHIYNVAFYNCGIKQRFIRHSLVKLRHVDYDFPYVLVRRTLRADSVNEIMRLELSVYTAAHVAAGSLVGAFGARLTGRGTARGRVS